ncbi:kinase-like protein [Macrolepiota fuliginosa MF-IS2]|uniref:Kinase-like protein n=1 Tax=Macrolepiota fuliginosa MF-IS2 TaxID=1400762 RepID=A0A9P5XB59_9AGAR|nr:kinase-like protein [Macrolepiota fuliginosa MF-IS2]
MFTYSPSSPLPQTPPQVYRTTPRLETPRFDSLSFSRAVSGLLEDVHNEGLGRRPSSINLSYDPRHYPNIRHVVPEWDDEQEMDDFFAGDHGEVPAPISRAPLAEDEHIISSFPTTPSFSDYELDAPCLSDFLVDPTSFKNGVGVCIKRSDGRLYAIKRLLQTRQAWSELAILAKVKEARASFNLTLHWTFEMDRYTYLVMENYPCGTLADAIGHYGIFGSLEVFFYACEIITGLRSLHDAGIVHRNVSPDTVIFDKHGHIVLSGLEHGTILQQHEKCFRDPTTQNNRPYQAPELLLGWSHDTLVDSWSFGMVLYYMFHGKHAFLSEIEDATLLPEQVVDKILSEGLPNKTVRFINPIARDLILKCLERNPAIRPNTRIIRHHPYFSNADWEKVRRRESPAPLPRDFLASNVVRTSRNTGRLEVSSREQCFSPRVSAFGPGSQQKSFSQATPRFLQSPFMTPEVRYKLHELHMTQPLAQSTVILDKVSQTLISPPSGQESAKVQAAEFDQARASPPIARGYHRAADFWDTLECEDRLSLHSEYSGPSLSNIKIPFARAWNLRKERSLTIYPPRFFNNLSTMTIQQKLRRRPKSIAALKYAAYAEPIVDLPNGLSQIGSGIGFTYVAPASGSVSAPGPSRIPVPGTPGVIGRGPRSGLGSGNNLGSDLISGSGSRSCPSSGLRSGPGAVTATVRNSIASNDTIPVPKACHGLFHSLSMSSFWTGFKSGSVGVRSVSLPRVPRSTNTKQDEDIVIRESDGIADTGDILQDDSEGEEYLEAEVTRPLAESTATLSPTQSMLSPLETSSTGSTASEEEVLTPDTMEFQPRGPIHETEDEIVEMKRSEEVYGLGPEATLRLVTPLTGLRLSFTTGDPH